MKFSKNILIKQVFSLLIFVLFMCFCGVVATTVNAENFIVNKVEIIIDFASYDDKFPDGVKGKTYTVFDATATDNLGNNLVVEIIVTNPENKAIAVSNGKFKTETVGVYTITYRAFSGPIEDVEIVNINVYESCEPISYEVSNSLPSSMKTGETALLYKGNAKGGSGNINVQTVLTLNGEKISITEMDDFFYFKPTVEGEYHLTYILEDFIGNSLEVPKIIFVEDSERPIMSTPPVIGINTVGEKVKLPLVDAILYVNGDIYFVPVKVFYDDIEITDTMTYIADETGEHIVTYYAANVFEPDNEDKAEKITIPINVVEPSNIYIADYFVLDNFNASYPENADGYLLSVDNGDAEFKFKSKINQEFVNTTISLFEGDINFNNLEIKLTDSLCAEDSVTIQYTNDKVMQIKNHNNVCFVSETTLLSEMQLGLYFKYDYVNGCIVDSIDNILLDIKMYDDGRIFKGFASEHIYISCRVNGVYSPTVFSVKSIASVSMSDNAYDITAPIWCVAKDFSGSLSVDMGEVVTLSCPKAFDLLNDDKVTYSLEITHKGTNTKIYSGPINGEYTFTINQTGEYRVRYIASDSRNQNAKNMTIHVEDRLSPSVDVAWSVVQNVKVGEIIKLPEAVYSDNISENCRYFIYVSFGDFLKDTVYDHSYEFKQAGKYVFTYSVWDDAGNNTTVKYVVNCS